MELRHLNGRTNSAEFNAGNVSVIIVWHSIDWSWGVVAAKVVTMLILLNLVINENGFDFVQKLRVHV